MAYLTQMRFASVQAADYYPATSLGGFTTGMTTEEMAGAYAAVSYTHLDVYKRQDHARLDAG